MISEKKYGKHFSRVTAVSTTTDINIEEPHEITELAKSQSHYASTFDEVILYWSELAIAHLKESNLPYKAWLFKVDGIEQWQTDRPTSDKSYKTSSLFDHITKELGYDHDGPEGILAKMLNIIDLLKITTHEDPFRLAYNLGQLDTLLTVYEIESNQNKSNARSSRGKKWADDLAEHLVKEDSDLSFTELWMKIPEDDELLNCYRLNKEGKKYLCYSKSGEKDGQIAYDTFRTEYIYPIQNKLKKK